MITNTGKNILSKFLISQAPAYASYIAIGCGPKPLSAMETFDEVAASNKTELDFEMLRLPIVSRGYIKDEIGQEKIVFTAELPTQERYEISEVGVYSAGNNPSAVGFDSRMLYTFSENEGWEYVDAASIIPSEIPLRTDLDDNNNIIDVADPAFFFTGTNLLFANANRVDRYERPRILNGSLAVVGNSATLSQATEESEMIAGVGADYLKLTGTSVSLNKNAPTDKLKLAFSVMNKDGNEELDIPDLVEILVRFTSSANPAIYANMQITVPNGTGENQHDFANNRYVVVEKDLQELFYRTGFSWGIVDQIEVYSSVTDSVSGSSAYYVAFDGLRFDNTTTQNPLYGLTGYTVFKTENGETVIKNQNTKNYIEFRFAISVGV